ncbi:helix-turn-helix domain-containing protein [Micromonospora sp. NBC_01796]|uniref:helix-turn-helix domain-containing protein n=1 Tax=Micromonospora sp. NBC_01796 TaxID=2975987 RepID=UPI002DDB88D0|nr:helix-turn-helix transcriptional regulator [Micromonospora sp. NBC_01796]WSA86201.1 helix-turn-helix domain-containing protein [Micromonospora sp. NBC_01796]
MDVDESTVPRRQLGRYLRELRDDAHITATAAAKALEWSVPRIWRYETGQVPMHPNDVEAMCRLYGATPERTETLRGLARETKSRGWWHSYGEAVDDWFKLYIGLEAAAVKLRKYEANVIPGLLQTVEYVREIMATDHPTMADPDRQAKTDVRIRRQGLLARAVPPAPNLDVMLSEAVLRRPLRSPAAMGRQLDYLVAAGQRHNVNIRVVPLASGIQRWATTGSFTIMDFATENVREPEPSTVYMDGPCGAVYLEKPYEIATYEEAWRSLTELALDPGESQELIIATAKEFHSAY